MIHAPQEHYSFTPLLIHLVFYLVDQVPLNFPCSLVSTRAMPNSYVQWMNAYNLEIKNFEPVLNTIPWQWRWPEHNIEAERLSTASMSNYPRSKHISTIQSQKSRASRGLWVSRGLSDSGHVNHKRNMFKL